MDKAYIVANKEQELEVLKRLEEKGLNWFTGNENPTEWLPSEKGFLGNDKFPYILFEREYVFWDNLEVLEDEEVVYDGRKEEKMSDKYSVTKEFMNELIKWRDTEFLDATTGSPFHFLSKDDLDNLNNDVKLWWYNTDNPIERNNRLIAIIQWLNGEDVFEVEDPHKFVVRSAKPDDYGDYSYVVVNGETNTTSVYLSNASKFDTREEAESWANSHQVVVEIDEEGNEVE